MAGRPGNRAPALIADAPQPPPATTFAMPRGEALALIVDRLDTPATTTFAMLPGEALALIVDRLDTPDRLSFGASCVDAAAAVAARTRALALPGGRLVLGARVPPLGSYLGLRALAVTACRDCEAARAANAPPPAPAGPPAAGAATLSHVPALAACLAQLRADCPHLRHLVLRSICACVVAARQPAAEQRGVLATIAASCPCLVTLSMPGWLLAPSNADISREELASLAPLSALRALGINCANALPLAAVEQLSRLSQLQSLSIAAAPASGQQPDSPSPSSGSTGGSVSTALAASLAQLPALTHLVLAGVPGPTHIVSGLTRLASLALSHLATDFAMTSFGRLAALTCLTRLSIRSCSALDSPMRAPFPVVLQELQQLQALVLDCELHLRDFQVIGRLGQLTHLSAASFHHCVFMVGGLSLTALRKLTVATLPQVPSQPVGQQLLVPAAAAGAMQAPEPAAPAAAAGVPPAAAAVSDAAAGLQQQQQQQQQQPVLMPGAGTVPLHAAPQMPAMLPPQVQLQPLLVASAAPPLLLSPAAAVIIGQQQAQQHWQLQQFQRQQAQLHLRHLQLQQQLDELAMDAAAQRRSHGRQKVLRRGQQQPAAPRSPSHSILQAAAAVGRSSASGQQQLQQLQQQMLMLAAAVPLPAPPMLYAQLPAPVAPLGQQQYVQVVLFAMPPPGEPMAAAAAETVPPPAALGWLATLCPALTQLELRSARGMQNAFVALQGHPLLQTLVLGTADAAQQQQQQRASINGAAPAESHPPHSSGNSEVLTPAAAMTAWSMLASLPSLTAVEVNNTGAVLPGSVVPLALLGRQLTRLVLHEAASVTDAAAAALLGTGGHWTRLQQFVLHGAQELSDGGLGCLSKAPGLTHLALSHCPRISAPGLTSLMLLGVNLRSVRLLCCAGITPVEAQAAADAVWAVGRHRVEVAWSRHDTNDGAAKRRSMV